MGIKPDTAAERKLKGNRDNRRTPAAEPAAVKRTPPLKDLSAEAKKVWRKAEAVMRRRGFSAADSAETLRLYCESAADAVSLAASLRETGVSYTTDSGMVRARPEVEQLRRARAHVLSAAKALGLTPMTADRLRRNSPEVEDDPEADRMLRLMLR